MRNVISFAVFAFSRQGFKICFGLCKGPLLHTLWSVVCGSAPSEGELGQAALSVPLSETILFSPQGKWNALLFFFYPDSKQGLQ